MSEANPLDAFESWVYREQSRLLGVMREKCDAKCDFTRDSARFDIMAQAAQALFIYRREQGIRPGEGAAS